MINKISEIWIKSWMVLCQNLNTLFHFLSLFQIIYLCNYIPHSRISPVAKVLEFFSFSHRTIQGNKMMLIYIVISHYITSAWCYMSCHYVFICVISFVICLVFVYSYVYIIKPHIIKASRNTYTKKEVYNLFPHKKLICHYAQL